MIRKRGSVALTSRAADSRGIQVELWHGVERMLIVLAGLALARNLA